MRQSDFVDAVRASAMETISGIVLILAGGYLTLFSVSSRPVQFAGFAVSTIGTLLVSWAFTRAWVSRQHSEQFAGRLLATSRPLSTIASQLNQCVNVAFTEGTDIDANLVHSALQHLYGVISDVQSLAGTPFSVDDMVAVKSRLDTLGKQLATVQAQPGDKATDLARVTQEINAIRSQLDSAVGKKPRDLVAELISCPTCGEGIQTILGTTRGDSAVANCPKCAARFHVHRGVDGTPFTRLWGGTGVTTAGSVTLRVTCPNCSNEVPLTVPREGALPQAKFCLACHTELQIDPNTKAVTVLQSPTDPVTAPLTSDQGITYLTCPVCNRICRTIYLREGTYYAVCPVDHKLLRNSQETMQAV